jgi:hypothetical protein
MEHCPESYKDVGHPIKLDHYTIEDSFKGYPHLYFRLLSREEGRNPQAHYGTLVCIYKKSEMVA